MNEQLFGQDFVGLIIDLLLRSRCSKANYTMFFPEVVEIAQH